MKILLVSDVESKYIWDYFDKERFNGVELIISCGDLKQKYLEFLATMINAPVFYVHGNHDKSYVNNPPNGCECIEDNIIEYKGIRFLGLGGSHKYNNGPFQYTQSAMKRRIRQLRFKLWRKDGFDVLVAHSPAKGIGDGEDTCHQGFEGFNQLINKYKPKFFFHGHQHLNYGLNERKYEHNSTLVVNAYDYYILDI